MLLSAHWRASARFWSSAVTRPPAPPPGGAAAQAPPGSPGSTAVPPPPASSGCGLRACPRASCASKWRWSPWAFPVCPTVPRGWPGRTGWPGVTAICWRCAYRVLSPVGAFTSTIVPYGSSRLPDQGRAAVTVPGWAATTGVPGGAKRSLPWCCWGTSVKPLLGCGAPNAGPHWVVSGVFPASGNVAISVRPAPAQELLQRRPLQDGRRPPPVLLRPLAGGGRRADVLLVRVRQLVGDVRVDEVLGRGHRDAGPVHEPLLPRLDARRRPADGDIVLRRARRDVVRRGAEPRLPGWGSPGGRPRRSAWRGGTGGRRSGGMSPGGSSAARAGRGRWRCSASGTPRRRASACPGWRRSAGPRPAGGR